MQTTYRLNSTELNEDLIRSIQEIYHNREIELVVTPVEDETEYLLKNDSNKNQLIKAVEEIGKGDNLIEVTLS